MTEPAPQLPADVAEAMRKAKRLAWISLAFQISIVGVLALVMGGSQALKTAWVEDMLSLLPPAAFLIAMKIERKPATPRFPFGFQRVNSLAFLIAATALAAMGALMVYESVMTLAKGEHPTIGSVRWFGQEVWLGWPMMAALVYSVIPPVILGRMKQPLARKIADKVLHTDALMNKADWQTGLAAVLGIVGVGAGLWWADAAAAGFIALSILRDGINAMRVAVVELTDGAPRKLESAEVDPLVDQIAERLRRQHGDVAVQVRETGRYMRAVIGPAGSPHLPEAQASALAGNEHGWRLIEVAVENRETARPG